MNGYSYLTLEQRREIERMYAEGERVVDIAARLKRSAAAIYEELKRGYTSIANAVIALIAAIITAFVIPWIRSKTTAAQFEKIKMWVTVAVEAAEQLYTGSGRGAEKKAYVV